MVRFVTKDVAGSSAVERVQLGKVIVALSAEAQRTAAMRESFAKAGD